MEPTYQLSKIKILVNENNRIITGNAIRSALEQGFDGEDIDHCICEVLDESHFYKTMPSEKIPTLWQDVYKLRFCGKRIYLKLQINHAGKAVIVSFKLE